MVECPFCDYDNDEVFDRGYVTPRNPLTVDESIDQVWKVRCENCGKTYKVVFSYYEPDWFSSNWTSDDEHELLDYEKRFGN